MASINGWKVQRTSHGFFAHRFISRKLFRIVSTSSLEEVIRRIVDFEVSDNSCCITNSQLYEDHCRWELQLKNSIVDLHQML